MINSITVLFIFVFFLKEIKCFKVAYVGHASDSMYKDFLKDYDDANPSIDITVIEEDATNGYADEFNKAVEDCIEMIVMKCNNDVYDSEADALVNNKILVVCTNTNTVGRCKKSIISGVSSVPLIENSIFFLSLIIFIKI